ncbi:MAG: hypothetical protein QMD21_07630 [Candidatus Thermoplasmatota archaeon]|nr:hypothetical protein [Candidatus Thermoplasmatota archaeon]
MKKENVKERRDKIRRLVNILPQIRNIEIRAEITQSLTPLGLLYANEMFEDELTQLTGERYQRDNELDYYRWGKQGGSIYLGKQKVPVDVPRVRDKKGRGEVRLM